MIKCDLGDLEVSGIKPVVIAEYRRLANSLLKHLGEDDMHHAFESGCNRPEKVTGDMDPEIKRPYLTCSRQQSVKMMTDDALELFRFSIVARACLDYDTAVRYLKRAPEKQTETGVIKQEAIKTECERFFRGSWFRCLCEIDGEIVMQAVKKNGYCGNNFAAANHYNQDGYARKWKPQGIKRREQRRKEMEEYEKRRKNQGNEKSVAP